MKKEKATIKDIAKYAGVSIATVSRYINKTRNLNPEVSGRIQAAIEHFNYIPNDNARALKSRNERIIGIIFPDITNAFFAKIFKILEELLFDHKIFLLLCNSNEDGEKEKEYLYRLLQKRVDAIVIAPTGLNPDLLSEVNKSTPVIIFDRNQPNIIADQLYANDFDSCYQLTQYILDRGHREVAYAIGAENSTAAQFRYAGFQKAMAENGVSPEHCHVLYSQDESACRQEFRELLLQDQISALLITSPKKLNWFLIERNQLCLKGHNPMLAFAGYATQNEFDICDIPLTGILQKEEVYASRLTKIILNRLEHPNGKVRISELNLPFRKGNSISRIDLRKD